jgi:hypothetical protein
VASFDEAIPPGQVGKIKAQVHTTNLSGKIGKTVQVTTNDPAQPAFALNIQGSVVASVLLLPGPRLFAYGGGGGNRPMGRLLVRRDVSESGELKVTDLKPSVPWLEATARKLDGTEAALPGLPAIAAGDWLVEVKATPPPGTTNSAQQIQFRTNLKREPEVTVPVSVVIPQFVTVQPSELTIRQATDGAAAEGTILAILRQDIDPQTVKIEVKPATFHLETAQAGPTPRHMRITVHWDPSGSAKAGTLVIRDADETKEIPIRVMGPGPS